jgi:hypothetical protein
VAAAIAIDLVVVAVVVVVVVAVVGGAGGGQAQVDTSCTEWDLEGDELEEFSD